MVVVGVVLIILLVLIFLALISASLLFYRIAVFRQPKTFLVDNPDLEQIPQSDISDIPVANPAWVDAQPFEILEMKSYDGLLLKGYYLAAPSATTKTVMLAHGYNGSAKENMGSLARMYYEELGFNIFMPDARGHGISEGTYIGMGWHDRLDYVKWMHLLMQRIGAEAQIVLHGISMGGATVLMVSGEPLPEQVKCVLADCAYTSANDIFAYQVKRLYKLPAFPFVPLTSIVCKLRAGYFFGEASVLKQVEKTIKPALFIHGEADTFVPTAMVQRLYDRCQADKEILLVPQAGHGMSYATNPTIYTQAVVLFLAKYVC
jgi:fermentation-respiration switch protein FrsA (DUF1100 family)